MLTRWVPTKCRYFAFECSIVRRLVNCFLFDLWNYDVWLFIGFKWKVVH